MSTDCVFTNTHGLEYEELTCVYPALKPFYTTYELNQNPLAFYDQMKLLPWVPILAVTLYVVGIVVGRKYFENRDPLNWRTAMTVWNLGLSLFSAIGFLRVAPYLYFMITQKPFRDLLCVDPETTYGSGSTGLWVQLFILSKLPELIDTLFIVVHKKKLIFLHWYHHVTVLLYCWHSYVTHTPSGIIFCCMNYAVHSIMYFYYFLMCIKIRPPWAMMVTFLQLLQMFVGVGVTVMAFYYVGSENCAIKNSNNLAAFAMYGSYFYLFLEFFVTRYLFKPKKTSKKKES